MCFAYPNILPSVLHFYLLRLQTKNVNLFPWENKYALEFSSVSVYFTFRQFYGVLSQSNKKLYYYYYYYVFIDIMHTYTRVSFLADHIRLKHMFFFFNSTLVVEVGTNRTSPNMNRNNLIIISNLARKPMPSHGVFKLQ